MRKSLLVVVIVVALLIIGGGAVIAVRTGGGEKTPAADDTASSSFGVLAPAEESAQSAQRLAAADTDNDGLINGDEAVWNTDPDNPDTDGDGYLDGEEVAAGHDPKIPAPNDLLAGMPAAPGATAPAAPLEPEQYLADDLDFTGGGHNLTETFTKQYGSAEQSPATMSAYAATQPVIDQLPKPRSNEAPATVQDTSAAIANYLAVADNDTALANSELLLRGQFDLLERNDPSTMLSLAVLVRRYREDLLGAAVPASALPVHDLLLGHSEALAATIDQIALYNEEPVRSMVATRQLETLDRKYYPLIRAEFVRLRALQENLAGS
jgi:hypothetical protein